MKRIIKLLLKIILIIILIGTITMIIDLIRVNNNQLPIFSLKMYNSRNKVDTYKGIIYTYERKVYASPNESINESTSSRFRILFIILKTTKKEVNEKDNINIEITKEEECTNSKLLDFNYEKNLYSYCIEDIKINGLKVNVSNLLKIDDKLNYLGFTENATIYGIKDLVIYKCNTEINDYYITSFESDTPSDLCTKREIEKRKIK